MFLMIVNIFLLLPSVVIFTLHITVAAVPSPDRAAAALRPLVALLAEAQGDEKSESEP